MTTQAIHPPGVLPPGPHEACHAAVRQAFKAGYAYGRQFGQDESADQVDRAERDADYWYFMLRNPGEQHRLSREAIEHMDVLVNRREQLAQHAEWDAIERDSFEKAKQLIWAGWDDAKIAVETGLFLPIVANLRAGVIE